MAVTDPQYTQTIDRAGLEKAQKTLLPKKESGLRGGDLQREFIKLILGDDPSFCDHVLGWGVTQGGNTPPITEYALSEREFLDPPWSTERAVAQTWSGLPVRLAARPETWTRIHIEMIQKERIRSSYLAGSGSVISGKARIQIALKTNSPKQIDDCVRTIFRRLGGVIADRANRTVFLDCPLARAWWRHRYAEEAHRTFGAESIQSISAALRLVYRWSQLIEAMVSKRTIIGDLAIRPAIVQALTQGAANSDRDMKDMLDFIGRQSTVQALGFLGPEYVFKLIEEQFVQKRKSSV